MDKSLTSNSEAMSKRLERGLTFSQAAYMKRNILEEEIKDMKSKYSARRPSTPSLTPHQPTSPVKPSSSLSPPPVPLSFFLSPFSYNF